MRKFFAVLALAIGLFIPLVATASPASADDRTCYSPHIAGHDTYAVCYYLPIEFTQ